MKKKIIVILSIVVVILCITALVACKDSDNSSMYDGTYYLTLNGQADKSDYIILKGDKWSNSLNLGGTFKVKDGKIDFYLDALGQSEFLHSGTIGDGKIKIDGLGDNLYYCLESKLPSGDSLITVTFDAVGGKFADGQSIMSQKTSANSYINEPKAPVRDGYTFICWSKSNTEKIIWNFKKDKVDADTTLYAVWEEVWGPSPNVVTVTLDVNGGEALDNTTFDISVELYRLPVPKRNGYAFAGWYNKDKKMTNILGIGIESADGMDGEVFTARWQPNSCCVWLTNLNPLMGEIEGSGFYDFDSAVTITATPIIGYDFVGWYDQNNQLVSIEKEYKFNIQGNADFTALFKVRDDIKPFEFLSSKTECVITGIKDKNAIEVCVPDYVTGISRGAFAGCNSIESLTVPFVGTSNEDLQTAFLGMIFNAMSYNNSSVPNSLKTVKVYGNTVIGRQSFRNCNNITAVELNNDVKEISSYAFENCSALKSVTLSIGIDVINAQAFSGCVDTVFYCEPASKPNGWAESWAPNTATVVWGYRNVTSDSNYDYVEHRDELYITRFKGDDENIEIPALIDNKPVVSLFDIFKGSNVKKVTIPSTVRRMGEEIFYDCAALEKINVNDGNKYFSSKDGILYDKGMTEILYIPQSLQGNVVIPEGVKVIADNAFEGRRGLHSILIPSSVERIGAKIFENCNAIVYCEVKSKPSGWSNEWNYNFNPLVWDYKSHGETADGIEWGLTNEGTITIVSCNIYRITDLELPEFINGNRVTVIADNSIMGNMESIIFPSGVVNIGRYAFNRNISLKSIRVNANNAVYSDLDGILYDKLQTSIIYVPKKIEGEIRIPDGVTVIEEDTFYWREKLTKVIFGKDSNLIEIGAGAFEHCRSLTSINLPNSVESIGVWAFASCALTSIELPSKLKTIHSTSFNYCDNLTKITVPTIALSSITGSSPADNYKNNVKELTINGGTVISESDFKNVSYAYYANLTCVEILNGVEKIDIKAFASCKKLETVIIPLSVTQIADSAFLNCGNLTVYCEASQKPDGWGDDWNITDWSNKNYASVVWGYGASETRL